jgi:hypothetical protein
VDGEANSITIEGHYAQLIRLSIIRKEGGGEKEGGGRNSVMMNIKEKKVMTHQE